MECTPARGPGCAPFNQTDKNPWGDPYRFRAYGSLQGLCILFLPAQWRPRWCRGSLALSLLAAALGIFELSAAVVAAAGLARLLTGGCLRGALLGGGLGSALLGALLILLRALLAAAVPAAPAALALGVGALLLIFGAGAAAPLPAGAAFLCLGLLRCLRAFAAGAALTAPAGAPIDRRNLPC